MAFHHRSIIPLLWSCVTSNPIARSIRHRTNVNTLSNMIHEVLSREIEQYFMVSSGQFYAKEKCRMFPSYPAHVNWVGSTSEGTCRRGVSTSRIFEEYDFNVVLQKLTASEEKHQEKSNVHICFSKRFPGYAYMQLQSSVKWRSLCYDYEGFQYLSPDTLLKEFHNIIIVATLGLTLLKPKHTVFGRRLFISDCNAPTVQLAESSRNMTRVSDLAPVITCPEWPSVANDLHDLRSHPDHVWLPRDVISQAMAQPVHMVPTGKIS